MTPDTSTWSTLDIALDTVAPDDRALAAKVLNIIRTHSVDDPVRGEAIAEQLGITNRDVQAIVGILTDSDIAIGRSWRRPFGYYLITDEDDLTANGFKMLRRGNTIRRRGWKYLSRFMRAPFVGQGELKFRDGEK